MRLAILSATLAALMITTAVPVDATGGFQAFRVVTTGDFYMVGLSQFCNTAPPDPQSGAYCFLWKTTLGYDGTTGAQTTQTAAHLSHAFECAVTGSATGIVGSALPYPANMAVADSISVGFDLNGDGLIDSSYGGRFQRRSISAEVVPRVQGAVTNGDVGTLIDTPFWYLSGLALVGATPVVSGNVDGAGMTVFNQGGSDVTIDCTF